MADVIIQASDDWVVVKVKDKKINLSSGHNISDDDWIRILGMFDIAVDRQFGTFIEDNEDNFVADIQLFPTL